MLLPFRFEGAFIEGYRGFASRSARKPRRFRKSDELMTKREIRDARRVLSRRDLVFGASRRGIVIASMKRDERRFRWAMIESAPIRIKTGRRRSAIER